MQLFYLLCDNLDNLIFLKIYTFIQVFEFPVIHIIAFLHDNAWRVCSDCFSWIFDSVPSVLLFISLARMLQILLLLNYETTFFSHLFLYCFLVSQFVDLCSQLHYFFFLIALDIVGLYYSRYLRWKVRSLILALSSFKQKQVNYPLQAF